jgi:large subunit ribosomal protein L22
VASTETQVVRAQARWVRSSARKARLVTDLIRGRTVPEARTILAFSDRAVARDVEKVLRSAVANAEANHNLHGDELYVVTAYADEGPTLKRWRARARGRVNRVRKRTCHITLVLAEVPEPSAPTRRRAASKPATEEQAAPEATKPTRARKPRTSRAKKKEEGVAG